MRSSKISIQAKKLLQSNLSINSTQKNTTAQNIANAIQGIPSYRKNNFLTINNQKIGFSSRRAIDVQPQVLRQTPINQNQNYTLTPASKSALVRIKSVPDFYNGGLPVRNSANP